MWMYSERSAESNVGGAAGMGRPTEGLVTGLEHEAFWFGEELSDIENLRLGLGRAWFCGGGGDGEGGITGGGRVRSGNEGSGYWRTSSRKGPQKYKACRTELA